ncbi:MAG: DinB family protein [Saprospiraceae bacterium]|nr:DinB family protein [Saprospiraceae bacterium]
MKEVLKRRNERYNQLINNLFTEMEAHTDAVLNRQPAKGGWSALQTMHHLILSEELSHAYVKKKLSFSPDLERAGLGAHWRGFLLWLSMNVPLKFEAPKAVSKEYLPAQSTLAETRARWQKARADWTDFFAQMPDSLADKALYKHPRAGRMGWLQMMVFFEAHFKRHLKQMRSAIRD